METINVQIQEEKIDFSMPGSSTWNGIAGKPTEYPPENHIHNETEISSDSFQTSAFANPLNLDATIHKDFGPITITGSTTININNASDGDGGMIEIIIDGTGGYTVQLGTMFTKGTGTISTAANADNIISWRKVGSTIKYAIIQVS